MRARPICALRTACSYARAVCFNRLILPHPFFICLHQPHPLFLFTFATSPLLIICHNHPLPFNYLYLTHNSHIKTTQLHIHIRIHAHAHSSAYVHAHMHSNTCILRMLFKLLTDNIRRYFVFAELGVVQSVDKVYHCFLFNDLLLLTVPVSGAGEKSNPRASLFSSNKKASKGKKKTISFRCGVCGQLDGQCEKCVSQTRRCSLRIKRRAKEKNISTSVCSSVRVFLC